MVRRHRDQQALAPEARSRQPRIARIPDHDRNIDQALLQTAGEIFALGFDAIQLDIRILAPPVEQGRTQVPSGDRAVMANHEPAALSLPGGPRRHDKLIDAADELASLTDKTLADRRRAHA